jgi:L-alanine-DL-glutamate epimerase-like enolase superfamily enzyme
MIEHAGLSFIQIDTGRVGGITPAKQIADLAERSGVSYLNHTFTSHLALSASLQPFAGKEKDRICEYPVESKQLATDLSREKIIPDPDGYLHVPEKPGLGISIDTLAVKKYVVEIEIKVKGKSIYSTPDL